MAMDERQQQIKEGAGLEESRLNQEFIDWLSRWGTTIVLVGVVSFLAYAGWERWQKAQLAKIDRAFEQLESLLTAANPSPESLRAIADEFATIRAVPHLARLRAADIYLESARRGVRPGARFKDTNDGTLEDPADLLGDEDRQRMLNEAEQIYTRVLNDTADVPAQALHALGAAYGLAAVAECRGDAEAARTRYERAAAIAKAAGLEVQGEIAARRVDGIGTRTMPRMYASAELPKLPWAVEPPPAAPAQPGAPGEPSPVDPNAPPTGGEGPTAPGATPPAATPSNEPPGTPPPAAEPPAQPPPGPPPPSAP